VGRMLGFRVDGLDGMVQAIGITADTFDAAARKAILTGVVQPERTPTGATIMRRGHDLETSTAQAFAQQGRNAYRGPWRGYALEPLYAAHKRRKGGGSRVGVWDGAQRTLRASFTRGNPDHIRVVTSAYALFGSRVPWAVRFIEGQFQRWDRIVSPARAIFPDGDKWRVEFARAFVRYQLAATKRANIPNVQVKRITL
jgi:hypothetical protein